ncbi:MAG: potassium transporter [Firmicutes bacterium HGW-Firmicutes-1]|jgi:Kef-type K+ transport system membrane component KefB|nr:MAG: potassium transporter [Firmicutes bacterium HGW-Firmicutes-1]
MTGIGLAIMSGFFIGKLINKLKIPSVAGYIIAGLILGQSFLGILNLEFLDQVSSVSDMALGLIAFSIGGELLANNLKKIGKKVFAIAFFEAFGAFGIVTGAMLLLKQPLEVALLLGAVASATAPAATVMVITELRAKGPLTSTLIAVVAIDDAICLMIYAVASSIARVAISHSETVRWSSIILKPLVEIGGSIGIGIVMGGILVFILGKVSYTREILTILIAAIMLTLGIATLFNLSALLSNMTLGIMVANLSTHRTKVFSIIESITAPIYTAFFVLAGARLNVSLLAEVGIIGLVYTVARIIGKIGGSSLGATITKADPVIKKYIGFGLLSQIGVAVGLAIVISHEFAGTEIGSLVITVLLATTVITEIVGPLCTRFAIMKSGENGAVDDEVIE